MNEKTQYAWYVCARWAALIVTALVLASAVVGVVCGGLPGWWKEKLLSIAVPFCLAFAFAAYANKGS